MIKQRVFQYGSTLIFTKGISFLFSVLIIRSLPITDIGTYYYLLGITTVLDIFITWGSPVTIQTNSGKIQNSNLALSASLLASFLGCFVYILFIANQKSGFYDIKIPSIPLFFIISTTFGNALTSIALAHYRSMLNIKNDIYILLAKELLKFILILIISVFFILNLNKTLILISSINVLIIVSLLFDFMKNSDSKSIELKPNIINLIQHGFLLMLTFFIYSFPIIFIRIFGYIQYGKEAAGLLNICLFANAGFQLYTSSWGMAIKPLIGKLNNQQDTNGINKLWKDTNQYYTLGCITLYLICLVFYKYILEFFKLDPNITEVKNVYFIILFYNLIYSLGAINNSFLQMLKLTKTELKAMVLSILLYPILIYYCLNKDIQTLAWAVVFLELFKLCIQEFVLFFGSELRFIKKLVLHSTLILIVGIITLHYLI